MDEPKLTREFVPININRAKGRSRAMRLKELV